MTTSFDHYSNEMLIDEYLSCGEGETKKEKQKQDAIFREIIERLSSENLFNGMKNSLDSLRDDLRKKMERNANLAKNPLLDQGLPYQEKITNMMQVMLNKDSLEKQARLTSLTNQLTTSYRENRKKMLDAARKQMEYLIKRYNEALQAHKEKEQGSNTPPLRIRTNADEKTNGITKEELLHGKRNLIVSSIKPLKGLCEQINAVSRTIRALEISKKENKDALTDYRNRVIAAHTSLTQEKKSKSGNKIIRTTDLKTIKRDLSPVTRFFDKVFSAVSSALIIGAGLTIARMVNSKQTRGHNKFWKPKGYDLGESVKKVERNLGITKSKKTRKS